MSDRVGRWHSPVCAKRKSVVSKCLLVEDVGCWLGLRCGELQWPSCSARFYSYCACFRQYTQVSVSFASVLDCVRTFIYGLCVYCLAIRASLAHNKRESTRASRSGAVWRHRIGSLSTSASTFKFLKIFPKVTIICYYLLSPSCMIFTFIYLKQYVCGTCNAVSDEKSFVLLHLTFTGRKLHLL
jgi:hypothetical protein